MAALNENLKSVRHFIALAHREVLALHAAAKRQHTSWSTRQPDLTQKRVRRATLDALRRFSKTLDVRIARMATTRLWQVVVMVTCVEAYLQDVLAAAARVDPTLMSQSKQRARYADVLEASSLEALASALRERWAGRWVRRGGPTRWATALEKMGAPRYPEEVVPTLERMWGIRHVVVHRAGVADAAFVKRHPGVVTAVGVRVTVSNTDLKLFLEASRDFVGPTDVYFLKRCPALVAIQPPPAPKA
jgi:hypothetical protein